MSKDSKHTPEFYWFPNHGDDDGNGSFTICYGDPDDYVDNVIVGAEDNEEDATEACKRLNEIILVRNIELESEVKRLREALARIASRGKGVLKKIATEALKTPTE